MNGMVRSRWVPENEYHALTARKHFMRCLSDNGVPVLMIVACPRLLSSLMPSRLPTVFQS